MKNKTLLVVILILISEFVLRYIHYTPNNQQYFFGLDESEIWKVKSDVLTLDKKGRNFFKIENVKLVGNEKVRILSIGDSVTWGDGRQKNNEAIINYTDYLNQIFSDSNIEILNFGAKTFASTRILKIVTEILKLHPQLVILQFGHSEFLENNTIKKYTISKSRSHLMLFHY